MKGLNVQEIGGSVSAESNPSRFNSAVVCDLLLLNSKAELNHGAIIVLWISMVLSWIAIAVGSFWIFELLEAIR